MIAKKSPRTAAAKKTTKPKAALVLNHTEFVDAGEDALNALIASLDEPDEIFETAAISDDMMEAAVMGAEAVEAAISVATPSGVIEAGEMPTGDATDVVKTKEPKVKAAKTPKEPKEPKEDRVVIPRKHYTDKTERLKDKLGTGLAEYSVLTLADAGVDEAQLLEVMEKTMGIIRAMNKKKANRAVLLIEFLAGKKAKLNEVLARVARLIERDGFVTTGNDGNVFKDLVARPYSPGAARAMGGNTVSMMADLKLITLDTKGRYVANKDSLLLMKLQSMMTGATPAAAEDDTEDADEEMGELVAA